MLLAEQNVKFCLRLSGWGYLLDKGAIQYNTSDQEIKGDDQIKIKYLTV